MGTKSISKDLLLEWQILSKILRSLWVLDKSTHWLICSRHKSIEKYILSYINADKCLYSSSKSALNETEYMRRDFLSDILDSFIVGNTKYISILRSHGLTKSEINHCCLMTLGLNSKEVGGITQNKNHYNNSSNIRAKFGLSSSETNLSIFLKTLYEKCQYETLESTAPK